MVSISASPSLLDLPNELIIHILQPFPTKELLPFTLISHRFHALIVRILQSRLFLAANLLEHTMLLECYPPSQKLTMPPLHSTYIGTPGLDTDLVDSDVVAASPIGRLAELRDLYSTFRPHRKPARKSIRRHPAGDIPGSRTHAIASAAAAAQSQTAEEHEHDFFKQPLSLEGHELFTQLCADASLARYGLHRGIVTSFVDVERDTIRVFRDWLKAAAQDGSLEYSLLESTDAGKGKQTRRASDDVQCDKRILWLKPRTKNVGIRTRVTERKWTRNMPLLFHLDDEIPVSYDVEYQELLVRTSHLLLKLEGSLDRMDNHTGRAVIFGSVRLTDS